MIAKAARLDRPRSTIAHNQVLAAAISLFAERGIDGTSMDAIAETSGVSKATIYKHWPDKEALCLEVMSRVYGLDQERPVFDSGDLRQDLIDLLKYQPPEQHSGMRERLMPPTLIATCRLARLEQHSGMRERLMPHLIAYAARNHEFGKAWRSRVLEPQRAQITELIERGIEQGIFPADINIPLALGLLIGPMVYTVKFGATLPRELWAEGVANAFWRAFARTTPDAKPRTAEAARRGAPADLPPQRRPTTPSAQRPR